MTARDHAIVPALRRPRRGQGGFTLLEVLVSLGIIIGALAGIAALLPAAGSRLADATNIDRAATMAANAQADLANRGLIRASLWSGAAPAIVFGEGLTPLASTPPASTTVAAANAAEVAARIDPTTGFQLRDSLQTTGVGIVAGYDPGICYGCMLSSSAAPSGAGARVRMTTVVFQKPGPSVQSFTLLQTGSGSTVLVSGNGSVDAALRRQYLAGCSWILAVSASGQPVQEPRWVQIASSWTAYGPGQTTGSGTGTSYVSLSGTEWFNLRSGTTLQAFGFDGLLRADERFVNLE